MLRQMRLASGTYYDRIPVWIDELAMGHRLMWFIYLSDSEALNPVPANPPTPISPTSLSFILNTPPMKRADLSTEWPPQHTPPIGMVCLLKTNPQDASLASIDTGRWELTSLWIYPLYRALGVGAAVMAEMEKQAAIRGASYVTFNTTASSTHILRTFQKIGYREYKPREHRYSVSDVLNAGLPIESTLAAFFEKPVITQE
jgi:ribosomal protein S18 acetylase RimI-like enzyme